MKTYYKYCTADTAKKIIESMSFQWRSPLRFNDPFDSQVNIYAGEDYIDDSIQYFIKELKAELIGESEESIKKAVNYKAQNLKVALEKMPEEWKKYASLIHVFCVTEAVDSLLMWSHYADSHRGVVFEVDLPVEITLRSVEYHRSMVKMGLMIDDLFVNEDYVNSFFFDNIFFKSDQWIYEKEWRAFKIIEDKAQTEHLLFSIVKLTFQFLSDLVRRRLSEAIKGLRGSFKALKRHQTNKDSYIKFCKDNIKAIYLGCAISEQDRKDLSLLMESNLPSSNVYQAQKHKSEYGLEFVCIKRVY